MAGKVLSSLCLVKVAIQGLMQGLSSLCLVKVAMQGLSSLCFVAAIVSAGASAAQRNEWRDRHSAMERTAAFERPAFFVHH